MVELSLGGRRWVRIHRREALVVLVLKLGEWLEGYLRWKAGRDLEDLVGRLVVQVDLETDKVVWISVQLGLQVDWVWEDHRGRIIV
jgi:cation transport ATPase